ncbi:hypothetical protein BDP27DRAFT_1378221 [Rhodocollybia butyracea]|uniref:Uncharacterized protein n=1 Tax=Rhodocollybia butyracea TaxID=206335 RepID=A0A9P5P3A5_9AGAR|nr:hypothetical protein BDP27DRAFT_1378221 [Rhodocollybia butyracea]
MSSDTDVNDSAMQRKPLPMHTPSQEMTVLLKLLRPDKGLLLFACAANRYLFDHESRIGASTNYSTVLDSLDQYAKADAAAVIEIASSEDESGLLQFDNMQKQIKARHERLGRNSLMLMGCAGT